MKSNEVQITFSNQTFKLTLNEGKSIDLRLKNDNGNIYMGKANANEDNINNRKFNGYSSVGLEPNSEKKNEKVEDVEEYQNESSTSSIHELLNKNVEREESSDVKEEPTSKQETNEKKADDKSNTNHDKNIVPDENTSSQEVENDDNELDDKLEEDNNTNREEYTNTNKENSTEREEKSESSQEKKSSLVNRYFPLEEDEE
ncbi:hypothetical protein [Staphylococcus hominis]|uniref:hypothetical protein n=1 Tax=Staphylococcus hominis TaxID=1290 RepID=UPI001F57BF58|nr:hypothetical protein [Staphylococcus hominis]MCI2910940.1 hypothetical protein [Staphylococcus hominis]